MEKSRLCWDKLALLAFGFGSGSGSKTLWTNFDHNFLLPLPPSFLPTTNQMPVPMKRSHSFTAIPASLCSVLLLNPLYTAL